MGLSLIQTSLLLSPIKTYLLLSLIQTYRLLYTSLIPTQTHVLCSDPRSLRDPSRDCVDFQNHSSEISCLDGILDICHWIEDLEMKLKNMLGIIYLDRIPDMCSLRRHDHQSETIQNKYRESLSLDKIPDLYSLVNELRIMSMT